MSVLNAGEDGGTINACFSPDLNGFVVTISGPAGRMLFESHHKVLRQGTGAFTDFTPVPEDGVTATGTRTPGGGTSARRVQMRAEVAIELEPAVGAAGCEDDAVARRHARRLLRRVHLTLEVFDVATGRTAFTLPFSDVMFNPQPEPPEPVAVP